MCEPGARVSGSRRPGGLKQHLGKNTGLHKTLTRVLSDVQTSHPMRHEACGRTIMVGFPKRLKMAHFLGHKEKQALSQWKPRSKPERNGSVSAFPY